MIHHSTYVVESVFFTAFKLLNITLGLYKKTTFIHRTGGRVFFFAEINIHAYWRGQ